MNNFIAASYFSKVADNLKNKFSGFGVLTSLLDILIVAFLLYALFIFLKRHNCSRLIKFIICVLTIAAVLSMNLFDFDLAGRLAGQGIVLVIIAVVLLFPQEIRRSLWKLSSPKTLSAVYSTEYDCTNEQLYEAIDGIVRATQNMAKKDVGALIIIAPQDVPQNILESGTKLDAVLTSPLLECLFNTKAPLHDGAVFIHGNRIMAAGCFLPLTQNTEIDKELGTRHRAAIGVSETNNVMAIIVSEETGIISIAINGQLFRYFDSETLHQKLEQVYGLRASDDKNERAKHVRRRK